MSEANLIAHQSALRTALHETRTSARGSTVASSGSVEFTNTQSSTNTAGSQRPSLSLITGTRAERSALTRRKRELLSNIKADAERWIDRALSSPSGGFSLREGQHALESLTSALSDIRGDIPILETLRNEVAEALDTFEEILGRLQSDFETPQETSPVVYNSGMC